MVDPSTTVREITRKLVQYIGVSDELGYSLFQILEPGFEVPLNADFYIADIVR